VSVFRDLLSCYHPPNQRLPANVLGGPPCQIAARS
jgi:hypothetical protein